VGLTTPALLPKSPEQEGRQSLLQSKNLFVQLIQRREFVFEPQALSCVSIIDTLCMSLLRAVASYCIFI